MINEQLLAYVRDNTRAGFSRADIEAGLRTAGWGAADIAAAFGAAGGTTASPATPAPRSETQSQVDTEVARIQAELKGVKPRRGQRQEVSESGIIGWMMRKKLVSSKQQANIILIAVTLITSGLAIWIAIK